MVMSLWSSRHKLCRWDHSQGFIPAYNNDPRNNSRGFNVRSFIDGKEIVISNNPVCREREPVNETRTERGGPVLQRQPARCRGGLPNTSAGGWSEGAWRRRPGRSWRSRPWRRRTRPLAPSPRRLCAARRLTEGEVRRREMRAPAASSSSLRVKSHRVTATATAAAASTHASANAHSGKALLKEKTLANLTQICFFFKITWHTLVRVTIVLNTSVLSPRDHPHLCMVLILVKYFLKSFTSATPLLQTGFPPNLNWNGLFMFLLNLLKKAHKSKVKQNLKSHNFY